MTHFLVFIIIPKEIYTQGWNAIQRYIDEMMEPYSEFKEVSPYLVLTKVQLESEFAKHRDLYESIEELVEDYGYQLDKEGNALSTANPDSFYDSYEIGGRWDGHLTDNNCIPVKELNQK